MQEAAAFSSLDPATVYTFSIRTEKEGFKDSTPNVKEIQTGTVCVSTLDIIQCSNAYLVLLGEI